jgi:hypothetical protein
MIFELFSQRRKKAEAGEVADVYQYETVTKTLRVQIQQILKDAIGPYYIRNSYELHNYYDNPEAWDFIAKTLRRELGLHELAPGETPLVEVLNFLGQANVEQFIDGLEVCIRVIEKVISDWPEHQRKQKGIKQPPDEALTEINYRFRQAGLGYQFAEGQALRVDSELLHENVVKPALRILSQAEYAGAQEEFLDAYRHYRNGEYEEAISAAAKAFESTLKITCDLMRWGYPKGARASDLLKVVRSHGLWPDYLDSSFDQLVATLASGLPKVRNEQSAHGQGGQPRSTPAYVASYALHLAAAKIILVAEASSALKA